MRAGDAPIYNLAGEKSRFFSNMQNMHDRIGDQADDKLPNLRPKTGGKSANRHKQQFEPCFDEPDNARKCKFFIFRAQIVPSPSARNHANEEHRPGLELTRYRDLD